MRFPSKCSRPIRKSLDLLEVFIGSVGQLGYSMAPLHASSISGLVVSGFGTFDLKDGSVNSSPSVHVNIP